MEGLKQLDDESIDLTVTSPPYDDLRNYNGYSFDFENTSTAYEFQYGVSEGDTNLDVQQKLARLVNTANVGAVASIDIPELVTLAVNSFSKVNIQLFLQA